MDFRSMLDQVKSAFVIGKDNSFLHGRQPERQQTQDYYEPQQQAASQQAYMQQNPQAYQAPYQQQAAPYADPFQAAAPQQQNYAYQPPQQAAYQQAQQQPYYQQGQQHAVYQQPQQAVYQQQAYQQSSYQAQPEQPHAGFQTQIDPFGQERNRRGGRHRDTAPEAPVYTQPGQQAENLVQFPGASAQSHQEQAGAGIDAYVINVFNLNSCRQAMSCLRRGQCTLIVMDQLYDKAEIRRYVDMLTGACYALNGTMTRLSAKIGFYIMAPSGMTVYTDPTTSNANSTRPPVAQAPAFGAASTGAPLRQNNEFAAQGAYSMPPQMSFSAHQANNTQSAQEAYQPSYQQPQQAAPQQDPRASQYQQNPYASYQEDQRYAQ